MKLTYNDVPTITNLIARDKIHDLFSHGVKLQVIYRVRNEVQAPLDIIRYSIRTELVLDELRELK